MNVADSRPSPAARTSVLARRAQRRAVIAALIVLLGPVLATAAGGAQKNDDPIRPFRTETPPRIDGILDDPLWNRAPAESGFKTSYPDYGQELGEKTIAYAAYDRDNLYFAFRCFDVRPDRIKASFSSRDSIFQDDWVCINLDSFDDQQSLYCFYVNPLGIQADSRFEGGQEDASADFVWESAGKIDGAGYAVEIRIPFKSIRYGRGEPVRMGIVYERGISRLSKLATYPPLDPAKGQNFLIQTRPMILTDIRHFALLELLPAVTSGGTRVLSGSSLGPQAAQTELSLTAKYALTSQIILDGTINPDFSQVEADAGQVDFNLRYALYYPEKRPFFLEGREKFNLAAAALGDPLQTAVHTRTIVDPYLGFKINGKIGPQDSLASIYAMDELPSSAADSFAHFAIVRYKHALADDSYVGAYLTGRYENERANSVGGADGQFRLSPSRQFSFHALFSRTRQDVATTGGHAFGVEYGIESRNLVLDVTLHDLSKGFETDTGYWTRNGLTRIKFGILPMIYPESKFFLRIDPVVHWIGIRDKFSGLAESTEQFDLRFILPRATILLFGGKYASEVFEGRRFDRNGVRFIGKSQVTKNLQLSLSWNWGRKIRYVAAPYQGRGNDASVDLSYTATDNLHFDLSLAYSDFTRSADGIKEFDYTIVRSLNTYQVNQYLFFRAIFEYNSFLKRIMTDFLASFTYIPGTVVHLGYGSLYVKGAAASEEMNPDRFLETKRSWFFKASYLWRL